MLEYKYLHECEIPPPHSSARTVFLWHIFLALLVMNSPLPAELKCRKSSGFICYMLVEKYLHCCPWVFQGFHRYSTDRFWHVPHFEKMLYDQAQLAVLYADGYQVK